MELGWPSMSCISMAISGTRANYWWLRLHDPAGYAGYAGRGGYDGCDGCGGVLFSPAPPPGADHT